MSDKFMTNEFEHQIALLQKEVRDDRERVLKLLVATNPRPIMEAMTGSVRSIAISGLSEDGLIHMDKDLRISLTEKGRKCAESAV